MKNSRFATSYKVGIYCAESLLKLRAIIDGRDSCTCFCSHSIDQHCFNALLLLSIDFLGGDRGRKAELIQVCATLRTKRVCLEFKRGFSRAIDRQLKILEKADSDGTLGTIGHRDIGDAAEVFPAYSTPISKSSSRYG